MEKSDGTYDGTIRLTPAYCDNLASVAGTLFFTASDGSHGVELWKSNGTTAGTVLVKDIAPGVNSSSPCNLAGANGLLYFCANGGELWSSNGTEAGTIFIDNMGNPLSASPRFFTAIGQSIFFSADDGIHGRELWVLGPGISSGTAGAGREWVLY